MSAVALELTDVRKAFRTWEERTLKGLLTREVWKPARRVPVLDGVTLTVQRGDFVALVGSNGSGKSTLFKLISGIFPADSGHIRVHGRVAPMIELYAGFHPDLTGRENLTLNAVLLGLSRRQLDERMAAILDFAALGEHLDRPTRYYSSGMLSRLGFALTIHVDADILLIDEVLAVGDEQFQARCLAELRARHARGVTVILVTHDLVAAEREASRCVWLRQGAVAMDGTPAEVLAAYRAWAAEPQHSR